MTHYFHTPTTTKQFHEIRTQIWGQEFDLLSSPGVFSSQRLDLGTSVLFRFTNPPRDTPARFLDLGCGIGPIACGLGLACPQAHIDAIDVNLRALELTKRNAERLGLSDRITALHPSQVDVDVCYDQIWSNPPIRIGKSALHELLTTWLHRLTATGCAFLVVGKNLGADSLHTWLADQGWFARRLGSSKGFRVLEVSKNPDTSHTAALR